MSFTSECDTENVLFIINAYAQVLQAGHPERLLLTEACPGLACLAVLERGRTGSPHWSCPLLRMPCCTGQVLHPEGLGAFRTRPLSPQTETPRPALSPGVLREGLPCHLLLGGPCPWGLTV